MLPVPPQGAIIPRAETLISQRPIWSTQAALDNGPEMMVSNPVDSGGRELAIPNQAPGSSSVNRAGNQQNSDTTPVARKSRPSKHQGTTFPDYGGVEALTVSPTIIKLGDASYIEIRCDRCRGNTSWAHETFIQGLRGMLSHLRQVHSDQPKLPLLLQRCKYRDVPAEEIPKIISGELKIDSISCQSTANVGMGTEYLGQQLSLVKKTDTVAADALLEGENADDDANEGSPSKKKKKRARAEPQPTHLENCHLVVQPNGEDGNAGFIELRCDVCHGNGSYGSGKLLNSVKGFKMHFKQIHNEVLSSADVLQRCHYRDVPEQEVQEIRAGIVSIGFIRCEGSARVRPKASYKNFNNSPRT